MLLNNMRDQTNTHSNKALPDLPDENNVISFNVINVLVSQLVLEKEILQARDLFKKTRFGTLVAVSH
jgi:hypothetical protein